MNSRADLLYGPEVRKGKAEEREKKQLSEGTGKESVERTENMNMRSCSDEREHGLEMKMKS